MDTKGKVAHEPRMAHAAAAKPVSVAWINQEYYYSPMDGMLVHHRVTWFIYYEVPTGVLLLPLDDIPNFRDNFQLHTVLPKQRLLELSPPV